MRKTFIVTVTLLQKGDIWEYYEQLQYFPIAIIDGGGKLGFFKCVIGTHTEKGAKDLVKIYLDEIDVPFKKIELEEVNIPIQKLL